MAKQLFRKRLSKDVVVKTNKKYSLVEKTNREKAYLQTQLGAAPVTALGVVADLYRFMCMEKKA